MSKERLLSTLALVRAGIEYGSKVWSLDTLREASSSMSKEEGNRVLAQRLMDQVYELSGLLLKGTSTLGAVGADANRLCCHCFPDLLNAARKRARHDGCRRGRRERVAHHQEFAPLCACPRLAPLPLTRP